MCGFNRKREGDWSDSVVVTNTDRTQQTIELINRIERLEKQLNVTMNALFEIETMEFERYLMNNGWVGVGQMRKVAKEALKQIKELEK